MACLTWGGEISLLGPEPIHDSAASPRPFFLNCSNKSLRPPPSRPPTPAPPSILLSASLCPGGCLSPPSDLVRDPTALPNISASLSRFWYPARASIPSSAVIDGIPRLILCLLHVLCI